MLDFHCEKMNLEYVLNEKQLNNICVCRIRRIQASWIEDLQQKNRHSIPQVNSKFESLDRFQTKLHTELGGVMVCLQKLGENHYVTYSIVKVVEFF